MADADPAAAQAAGALLSVGRIGRAHGLDGSFYVTQPRERALGGAVTVFVDGVEIAIVRHDGTPSRPILRLAGVESREAIGAAARHRSLGAAGRRATAGRRRVVVPRT